MPESYRIFCGTVPEHMLFGLRASLGLLFSEGLESAWARHLALAAATRAAVEAWSTGGALEFNIRNPAARFRSRSLRRHPRLGYRRSRRQGLPDRAYGLRQRAHGPRDDRRHRSGA